MNKKWKNMLLFMAGFFILCLMIIFLQTIGLAILLLSFLVGIFLFVDRILVRKIIKGIKPKKRKF